MSNPYDSVIGGDQQEPGAQPSNPYDKAVSDDLNTVNTIRAQAAAKAAEVNPQAEQKLRSTAKRIGIAPDLLRENMEEAERALKKQDLESEVGQFSSYSQQFLMEDDNLGVLQDDLPRLKALDQAISNMAYHDQERQARERGFFSNTARGFGERGADLLSNLMEFGNNLANEGEAFIQKQGIPNPGVSYGTLEEFEAQGRQPDMVIGGYGVEFRGDIPAAETDGIQPLASAVDVELGYQPYFTSERIKEDITAGNIAGFIGEQGLVSLPDMFAAMFATPAYIASRTEEIGEERVANDLREGQPELADLAAAAPAAVASALIERWAGLKLFNPATKTVAGAVGAAVVREGATEFVQEQIEYAGGTVGTATPFDLMTSLETGAWAALAGAGMGGGISSLQQVYARTTEYNRAKRDKSYLKQVGDAANESETDKQVLRDMIARSKAGGPVSEVYVDANEFRTLFQSAGLDPDAIADRMPSIRETYYESAAIGGDLAISLEDYATVIPETAVYEDFINLVRTEPSGMTNAEAQQWYDEQAKPMIEAAMQYDPAAENPGGDQVEQDVIGQLLSTGMDQATAERNAAPIKAFFTVLGTYEGRDPFELYQEYGLSIGQPKPDILQRGQQVDEFDNMLARLRAGEIPTEQEIEGQSLVQFLRESGGLLDDGGELSAMDADEGRAAFEKRLVQETGLSLDAAAEIAAEAGYITERDPNQLLDRINNELRGNPVYSPANANDQLRTLAADLIELDDALREAGLDPASMTNEEIRAAIMDEQPAGQVEFDQQIMQEAEQSGYAGSSLQEAAEWVSASRKGLDMSEAARMKRARDMGFDPKKTWYHGTDQDITEFSPERFGSVTGAESAAQGVWMSDSRRVAQSYADYAATGARVNRLVKQADEAGDRGDWDGYDEIITQAEQLEAEFADPQNRLGGQNIMPLMSRGRYLKYDAKGESFEGLGDDFNEVIRRAKEDGYDGVEFRNLDDAVGLTDAVANHRVTFDPANIRSTNAAFDPDESASANILAQGAQPGTDAFSNWFGDSKVVDANGEPLVVYHGTFSDFDSFRESDDGVLGPGIYFAKDADEASDYAGFDEGAEGGSVIPVYVSISNPAAEDVAAELESDLGGQGARDELEARGHDGIIGDGVVVAFRPEQIKSAAGNRGTFDPNDPNILNQGPAEGSGFNGADVVAAQVMASPVGQIGLTDEQMDVVIAEFQRRAFDSVSGWLDGKAGTMKRDIEEAARQFIEDTGESVRYLSLDISNLGGLNAFRNDVAEIANQDYRAMTDIMADEINGLGEAIFMRTGGDELGAFIVGASEAQIMEMMDRARARIKEYATQQGFADIPHAKGKPIRGVSMYGAAAQLLLDSKPGQVYNDADEKLKVLTPDLGEENATEQQSESGAEGVQQEQSPGAVTDQGAGQARPAGARQALRSILSRLSGGRISLDQSAFHGTPHQFDSFSLDAIGTGEGAQAFGWGLYFAGKREIAEWYRGQLAGEGGGQLYQVDVPPDDQLLNWSAPLSEQPESVKKALASADLPRRDIADMEREELIGVLESIDPNGVFSDEEATDEFGQPHTDEELAEAAEALEAQDYLDSLPAMLDGDDPGAYGRSLYLLLESYFGGQTGGTAMSNDAKRKASEFLNSIGIPGLRYKDADSRIDSADGETYNYVIWDEDAVTVEAVNDELRQAETQELNQSEQPDLFVAHNITAPGVLAANDLGGLAAPSIAVARSGVSNFDSYGEITLLADPSLLESAKVRTFDADVYSPRQPRPVYDLNLKKFQDMDRKVSALPAGSTLRFPDPESLSSDPNALLYSDGAKALYLDEQGKLPKLKKAKVEPWVKKAAKWGKSRYELQNDERFEKLILDETKKHLEELREADPDVAERYESRMIERDEDGTESVTFHILSDRASKVERFVANDGLDPDQLKHDVSKKFRTKKAQADFEKWARETFNDMVEGKKIFKGFTPSGNRRYSDYTLSNVVREMTRELQGGENFNYGAGSVRAALANEMRKIEDVQSRRDQIVSPEEFEAVKEESQQKLTDALEALKPYYKFDADGFGYLDDASSAIAEGRRGQAEAFELNDESRAIISDLTSYLRSLPTEYFEAKAQRAVDFSEFSMAVVPKGADRDAVKVLRDAGLRVKYYDPDVSGDRAKVIGQQKKVLFQSDKTKAPRGRINIDRANKNFNIELLEGADLSTFLHETGHYFLEVLGDIATNVNASDRTRGMYDDLLVWMGVDSREDIGVEQHELFARTFEAYLREGKAPTPELRNVFKRFSAWLKQIYRSLTQLDAKLTDEVRSVFDRMLATDEEIQQAQEDAGYLVSLEDVEGIEWSEDEKRQLAEMKEDARAQAESDLMAEQMKDISKSQKEWWEKERAQVSREMWDSLNGSPQYQARQMLTAGKRANGDPLPAGVDQLKLSKQALVDEFGAEFLKELPSPRNPNNKAPQYAYTAKGGEDPAVVARAYGYGSARELVNALIESKPVKEYVAALTEAEMRQRHPDINLSGQAAEIARESVYNDKQAQLMLLELKKLEAMVGRKPSIPKVMRDKAADIIAGKKVRDIRPDVYANKTRKHGREAFDAARKGKIDQAMLAKQREIMHHYLYKEALKARQQSEKVYQHAKRLQKKAAQERIGKAGGEYLDRINDLLSQYEFRRVSNREIERRQSFAEWLKGREADGDYVDVPTEVVERSQRVNWRDIPMEELLGVDDALKNLEHTARMKNKLLADKDKRDLEEVLRPVVDQVLAKGDKAGRGFFEKDTLTKRAQRGARDYASAALNMDTILRGLDGYEDLGVVYQAIKAPIDRASREELPAQQEKFGNRLAEVYNKHFTREEQRHLGRQDYVQLSNGKWLSRDEALSLALNLGNEGNLEAVYSGVASAKEQLQPADIQKVRDSLQKADWEFVQDVWDIMDFELWPMVRDVQKGRTGVAPKKVEATPVQTKFGTYRGGYYPIKFDPGLSFRATEQEADQMAQQVRFGSFAKAQTRRGHTIERTNSGGNPLNYSLSVLHSHIDQALVDVTLGNAINDVSRIITHRDFVNAMQRTGNTWALKAMENWLKDTASQEVVSSHFLSRAVRHIRVGFTMSKLAWNVGTILLQPMGLAQSIPDIGYRNMMAGLTAANPARWFGEGNIFSQIQEKSPFMRSRGASFNKDIRDTNAAIKGSGWTEAVLERIPGMKGISQPVAEMMKESLMGGIVATQQVVDAVVWMGAYQKGKTDFTTDAEAIQYADMMVARTQASGIFSDRTSFERGTIDNQTRQSEFVRLWTTLGSYMFAKGNIAYEKTANTDFRSPQSVLKWMHDMFMLFTFETIMIALMKGLLPGEDDDETVAGFLAEETVYNVMGTMPLLREASSALAGFSGGGVLGSFWADFAKIKTQAEQGEVDAPLLKALNNTGGVLFKYPSSQMNRIADAFWRDINGEDVKIMDYLMYNEFDE